MTHAKFTVGGMSCAACQAHVEQAVGNLDGVENVVVNLLANTMTVDFDDEIISADDISRAVDRAGYTALCPLNTSAAPGMEGTESLSASDIPTHPSKTLLTEAVTMKRRVIVSLALLIPLMYVSMGHMMGLPLPHGISPDKNPLAFGLIQLVFALFIILINRHYFTRGFKALIHRSPTMDTLVAIGSTMSLLYSAGTLVQMGIIQSTGNITAAAAMAHNHLYLEGAASILCFVSIGKYLETRSKSRTSEALENLIDLAPAQATIYRDGNTISVDASKVVPGDSVLIRPGEAIPVDGVILEGLSAIDESTLTGEPIPTEKTIGDTAFAGTINGTGSLTLRATRTAGNTSLSRIVNLIEDANATKAPIARIADKVASVFVPIVLAISAVTFIVWMIINGDFEHALTAAVCVVVISCPCALGLATPVAIMVGTGRGAEMGILFKSAEALETLAHIDTIVLDKTGTITTGKPEVTDVILAGTTSERSLLKLVATLEAKSEHPLAKALLTHTEAQDIYPREINLFEARPGMGVVATEGSSQIAAGNTRLMNDLGVDLSVIDSDLIASFNAQGKTVLYFSRNNKLTGAIALADTVKPTSAAAIEALKQAGVTPVMLTGDSSHTASHIACEVGIDDVIAGVLPAEKDAHVRELIDAGKKVAMVGDGINDAVALARAHVGVAIGAGADIAIDSADVILMHSDLQDLPRALNLSRAVLRNIKQDLFWALFYNSLGIPLASGILYPLLGWQISPMFAAAAMSLSSVTVVSNALRLKKWGK